MVDNFRVSVQGPIVRKIWGVWLELLLVGGAGPGAATAKVQRAHSPSISFLDPGASRFRPQSLFNRCLLRVMLVDRKSVYPYFSRPSPGGVGIVPLAHGNVDLESDKPVNIPLYTLYL